MKAYFLFILLALIGFSAQAQKQLGFAFSANSTAAFAQTNRVANIKDAKPKGFQLEVFNIWNKQSNIDDCNCLPKSGVIFTYFDLDNSELLGKAFATSLFMEPQFKITPKYILGVKAQAGFVYANKKFDPISNPGNLTYSSNISNYLALGLTNNFLINKNTTINASFIFNHISNGGIKDPNNGLNFPGINLGLTYFLNQVDFNYQRKNKSNLLADAKYYISTFFSATTTRNLSTKKYPIFGLEISRTKQLNGVLFHIAAIDLYQDQALRQKLIQDGGLAENQYRSGISTGIGFKMGRVNFASSIGTYLYDPINYYNRIFHRHEISYAFKERWSLGINLKAHTYIANYTDIRLKYQLK